LEPEDEDWEGATDDDNDDEEWGEGEEYNAGA